MDLIKLNGKAMDSREIARLTGKRHDNVLRDIEEQLGQLEGGVLRFEDTYQNDQNGQTYRCYLLPKRECLILASGYSVVLRAAIIDRWAELEAAASLMLPKTYAEALRLAADQAEELERQRAELQEARPAAEFVERYVEAKANQPIRMVAKVLGMKEKDFVDFLLTSKIMYRLRGKLTPAAEHIEAGRFEVKAGEAHGHAFTQATFTPAGVEWVARRVRMAA